MLSQTTKCCTSTSWSTQLKRKEEEWQWHFRSRFCFQRFSSSVATRADQIINKCLHEGGVKSNTFWKIRNKLLNKDNVDYEIISEEGITIDNPDLAKQYVANYYSNLYTTREPTKESLWTVWFALPCSRKEMRSTPTTTLPRLYKRKKFTEHLIQLGCRAELSPSLNARCIGWL